MLDVWVAPDLGTGAVAHLDTETYNGLAYLQERLEIDLKVRLLYTASLLKSTSD